jgi:hypothetical protein
MNIFQKITYVLDKINTDLEQSMLDEKRRVHNYLNGVSDPRDKAEALQRLKQQQRNNQCSARIAELQNKMKKTHKEYIGY